MPKALLVAFAGVLVAGCNTLAHFNEAFVPPTVTFLVAPEQGQAPLLPVVRPEDQGTRATVKVDGKRGNEKVLFFLALSGGGSRAAWFSAATMLRLEKLFSEATPPVNLLHEVDVISSVSGGSLPAAYYALSRDEGVRVTSIVLENLPLVGAKGTAPELLRRWDEETVRDAMTRNYLLRSTLNWFWPSNIAAYWLTSYDRSDIMAKTLEDNLYDTPLFGDPLTFAQLNPKRPYLILNATSATGQSDTDEFTFGSVFTFTQDDFGNRLRSSISGYPVARAVQASAAFPALYANVTLRDFRPFEPELQEICSKGYAHRKDSLCDPRYLHVFDGGNSDNLGLRSIKRALFELRANRRDEYQSYDKVVVLLVDAFTKPKGALRTDFDPRSIFGRLVDPNFSDAIDSLLQANRAALVDEFRRGILEWGIECGSAGVRHLPGALCDQLTSELGAVPLDVTDKLVFYHFSFDRVPGLLKDKLDLIPTSFAISEENVRAIEDAVKVVLTPQNDCMEHLRRIVLDPKASTSQARAACSGRPSSTPAEAREDKAQSPTAPAEPVQRLDGK